MKKHILQSFKNCNPISEDTIRQKESVQEINVEKPQVCQTLQQTFWSGITNLRNLKRDQQVLNLEKNDEKTFASSELALQVLKVLENRMSTSSLNKLGSLLTHCGKVEELAFGVVL